VSYLDYFYSWPV